MPHDTLKRMLLTSGLDRLVRPVYTGRGVILCFHRVYPDDITPVPARQVSDSHITPDELSSVLTYFIKHAYEFVSLDQVPELLATRKRPARFAVVTFDDGYADTLEHALPVMERHNTPFTVYVSPGPPEDHIGIRLLQMNAMVEELNNIVITGSSGNNTIPAGTKEEKLTAFHRLHNHVMFHPEGHSAAGQLSVVMNLLGNKFSNITPYRSVLMNADQLASLDRHPLATVGAHTINHANLAVLDEDEARTQIEGSKHQLETLLGHQVEHFAYPYGGRAYASVRDFRIASEAGFITAVTCRQGFLYGGHSAYLTALPRIIIGTGAIRDQRLLALYESGIVAMKENHGRWFVTD